MGQRIGLVQCTRRGKGAVAALPSLVHVTKIKQTPGPIILHHDLDIIDGPPVERRAPVRIEKLKAAPQIITAVLEFAERKAGDAAASVAHDLPCRVATRLA